MYQVLVVDDEPMAVSLIVNIIQKKYSEFEIMGTAYDGAEALKLMEEKGEPDVLITDIKMPVMDGLSLVENTKERYPEVISVIVSGFPDFEYAKKAISYGVSEYILKPIVPSEFASLVGKLENRLKEKYYRGRNILMHRMVNGVPLEEKVIRKYFHSDHYYGAIIRLNALPSRYGDRNRREVFSDIHELMVAYGRDSEETLYLCPEELISPDEYESMMLRHIGKEQPEAAYITMVMQKKLVAVSEIGEMVRRLYKKLDASIVLGKNQVLILDEEEENSVTEADDSYDYMEELEYFARNKKFDQMQKKVRDLIHQWNEQSRPQIWVEGRLRQICYLFQRYDVGNADYREVEFLMDDIFAAAENADQLCAGISDIFFKEIAEEKPAGQSTDTEEFFKRIRDYVQKHMAEPLSLHSVSKSMGVSQTYLSRLFRKYEDVSFNSYLTSLRMEKAKQLLLREDKMFVKDVAEQVGYKDQFYFSRIFYSYTGVRPSEYGDKE